VIFLTVGTHEPFDRLVRTVDEWCKTRGASHDVLGQITTRAGYQPTEFRSVTTLEPDEYIRCFREADFVVAHAGMGSIITALSLQKPIAILPRRGHLQETRNDHQFAATQRFRDKPGIFAAEDEFALPGILDQLAQGGGAVGSKIPKFANVELIDALRSFIHDGGKG
jgi:UDP-N-acetylglucosamine transferase subunit ALG13